VRTIFYSWNFIFHLPNRIHSVGSRGRRTEEEIANDEAKAGLFTAKTTDLVAMSIHLFSFFSPHLHCSL